jgi:hypothetical protein
MANPLRMADVSSTNAILLRFTCFGCKLHDAPILVTKFACPELANSNQIGASHFVELTFNLRFNLS